MKFNINNTVKVKLTEKGLEILREQWSDLQTVIPSLRDFKEPIIDKEGYTKFQLWGLIQKFGSHVGVGIDSPFEIEIEIETEYDGLFKI